MGDIKQQLDSTASEQETAQANPNRARRLLGDLPLELVVTLALIITVISPVALAYLWIKDWRSKKLW